MNARSLLRASTPTLLACVLLAASAAWAQAPAEEAQPEQAPAAQAEEAPADQASERRALREELEKELRAELDKTREQMRAEIRAAVAASMAAEEWQPEQWEVQEKPKQAFFDLDGYFRVRPDAFINFDLNAGLDPSGRPAFPRPGFNPDASDTLAGVNQRLRLQPLLNVSEDIKIRMTVDVLDNLVWGQTPASFPLNRDAGFVPLLAFNETQVEPTSGINAAFDSISVKRVWAEVLTPLGMLRFGRMPSHWGLGIMANDGNCLDCDYGDTWDRFMFITKVGDFYIVPAVDIAATGPIFRPQGTYQDQPFDLEQRDDVNQYVLTVARRDNPEDIQNQLLDGKVVFNYGLYNVLRIQAIDAVGAGLFTGRELERADFVTRDALLYTPDLWVQMHVGKLRVELEALAVFGRIGNGRLDATDGDGEVTATQFGGVIEAEYKLVRDQLRLGLEVGFASGDSAPGMGVRSSTGYPLRGSLDGRQYNLDPSAGPIDRTVDNFEFDPDYHVDLILWREILGRVTDAVYVKPTLAYDLTPGFGFDVSAIYSRALFTESTPGGVADLGIEIDGALRYRSNDGFNLAIQYGILFPLNGFQLGTAADQPRELALAQTVQALFGVEF